MSCLSIKIYYCIYFSSSKVHSLLISVLPLQYNGANVQLLDLPGIIEGASQGEKE